MRRRWVGRRMRLSVVMLFIASNIVANRAAAEPLRDWIEEPWVTGDWGGKRLWLAERGIVPFASYLAGFWSNTTGGFDAGTRYEGFARWGVDLDLGRSIGWRGGRLYADMQSYHGSLFSEELVGPYPSSEASGWEAAVSVRFYEFFLEQTFWGGRALVKLGQLATERAPWGRRGRYTLGLLGTSAKQESFTSGAKPEGAVVVYAMLDQLLVVGAAGQPTLGCFVRTQLPTQPELAELRWYLDAGLRLSSPFPGRESDVASVGVAHHSFGREYLAAQRAAGENTPPLKAGLHHPTKESSGLRK